MKKRNSYPDLKKLLDENRINYFDEIVHHIGSRAILEIMEINLTSLLAKLKIPEYFTLTEIEKLALVIEVDSKSILYLLFEDIEKNHGSN